MKTLKIEMIWKDFWCINFFFRSEDVPRPAARLRRSLVSSSRASGSSHEQNSVPAYIPAPEEVQRRDNAEARSFDVFEFLVFFSFLKLSECFFLSFCMNFKFSECFFSISVCMNLNSIILLVLNFRFYLFIN